MVTRSSRTGTRTGRNRSTGLGCRRTPLRTRRRLLRAHGLQQPQGSLFDLDDDLTTGEDRRSPPRTRPHLHLAAQRRASCHRSARRVTAGKGPGRRCAERGPSLPPQSSPKHPPERLGGTAGGSRPRRRPENQPQLPPHWHGPPDWQPQEQPGPQPQLERWGSGVEVRGMGCLLGKRGIGCRPLPLEARSTRRINGARWHGAPSNGPWTEPGAATRPPPVPARRSRPRARR